MVDYKATDGLFTVFGQVTLEKAFLVIGHTTTRIHYLIVALSLEELILANDMPKAG